MQLRHAVVCPLSETASSTEDAVAVVLLRHSDYPGRSNIARISRHGLGHNQAPFFPTARSLQLAALQLPPGYAPLFSVLRNRLTVYPPCPPFKFPCAPKACDPQLPDQVLVPGSKKPFCLRTDQDSSLVLRSDATKALIRNASMDHCEDQAPTRDQENVPLPIKIQCFTSPLHATNLSAISGV